MARRTLSLDETRKRYALRPPEGDVPSSEGDAAAHDDAHPHPDFVATLVSDMPFRIGTDDWSNFTEQQCFAAIMSDVTGRPLAEVWADWEPV